MKRRHKEPCKYMKKKALMDKLEDSELKLVSPL